MDTVYMLLEIAWELFCKLLGHPLFWIGLVIVGMVWFFFAAANYSAERKQVFMEACTQDHKEYECTLMWRQSDCAGSSTQIVPIYMPVHR